MKALWLSRRYALKAHCSICLYTISQHLALLSSPSSHEAKCDTNASLSLMVVCEASEVLLTGGGCGIVLTSGATLYTSILSLHNMFFSQKDLRITQGHLAA